MHISTNGLHLIEGFEGFVSCPYWDSYGGVWTVGYGQTEGVGPHSPCISQQQAQHNLQHLVEDRYEWAINDCHRGFNQNQFDALCSVVWNLGTGIIENGSQLGNLLREHHDREFADALLAYDHAGGVVLEGLSRRRQTERRLYLAPVGPTDPLAVLLPYERAAVVTFDHLRPKRWTNPVAYRKVKGQIVAYRQAVWYAAERGVVRSRPRKTTKRGWYTNHRAERYNILRSRVR